jgi:hypothetical protein
MGVGVQTPTIGAVLSLQGSSARNVDQFSGLFGYGGLSVRGGPEFGVGIFGAQCSEAPGGFVGGGDVNLGAGFGLPLPAEVHGGQSETQTQSTPSFSPVKDFVNGMRNWATSLAASRMGY